MEGDEEQEENVGVIEMRLEYEIKTNVLGMRQQMMMEDKQKRIDAVIE
jgi:hypothetical protein